MILPYSVVYSIFNVFSVYLFDLRISVCSFTSIWSSVIYRIRLLELLFFLKAFRMNVYIFLGKRMPVVKRMLLLLN